MDINKVINSLKQKGYLTSFFKDSKDATNYLASKITNVSVGFGDSKTLLTLNLYEILSSNNKIYDPQQNFEKKSFLDIAKKSLTTDVYLTSVNALSETGELVNIDGTGNRIAGCLFGHQKVYFIIGINKIVPSLEDAILRARNIAAPLNAQFLKLNTPCAKEGKKCFDCSSPDRICNGMIVHFKKMSDIEMEIVIIDENLGF